MRSRKLVSVSTTTCKNARRAFFSAAALSVAIDFGCARGGTDSTSASSSDAGTRSDTSAPFPDFDASSAESGTAVGDASEAGMGSLDASETSTGGDILIGYTGSDATKGINAGNGALTIGREFRVAGNGISIRDLGVWDESADGLMAPHTVTLFALDKIGQGGTATPVPGGSVTVPAGTGAPLDNGFRFAALPSPVVVTPGNYAVIAYGLSGQDPYGDNGNVPLSNTGIVNAGFDPYEFTGAASPQFPTSGGSNLTSISFHYEKQGAKFVRIMPFGDSITAGYHGTNAGYRAALGALLDQHGYAYQFVGGDTDLPGSLGPDQIHHEGHSGFLISGANGAAPRAGIADFVGSWLGPGGVAPDIILLMIGTNDIDTNFDLPNAGSRLDALISRIVSRPSGLQPNARLIVAQVVPCADPAEDARAVAYNAQVAAVVARHRTAGEDVSLVDMHSVIAPSDLADNLHPNDVGYGKMAQVWFNAIVSP